MELERPAPCRPPRWARGGHAQTIVGHLWPSVGQVFARNAPGVECHTIEVSEGDRLLGHYVGTPKPDGSKARPSTLVLLFHGLAGSSNADYVRRIASLCLARGHSVFAVNHRGCGEGVGLARGPYHSGRSDDITRCLAFADEHLPHERRVVVGFSLSGNALLLQLARERAHQPDAAIAVNPPVDLALASQRISAGLNRIYDLRFVHYCRSAIRERHAAGLLHEPIPISRLATLETVDERFTAPYSGFADAADYYARCSTHRLLVDIERPTVILSSHDDPFVPSESLTEASLSPSVHLHVEASGGHLGYLNAESTPLGNRRWLDYAVDHYLAQLCLRLDSRDANGAAARDPRP